MHRETLGALDGFREKYASVTNELEQHRLNLLYGMDKYRFLGLSFQRTANDCLAFIFTQLDPRDPMRAFQFSVFVDSVVRENGASVPITSLLVCIWNAG
jgi:hypothetical protein